MQDKYNLIKKGLIPPSKYWSIRLGFLDILNNTHLFIPKLEKRNDLGDDLKVMIKISKEWENKNKHNVGEAGSLYRLLQFASWKYDLNKKFVKEKTLKKREICNDPNIINWSVDRLLELDNNTPQWASASILTGSDELIPNNYFLKLSQEALKNYNKGVCEIRDDDTLLKQAQAFIDLLKYNKINFKPLHQDDYCFSRMFNILTKQEAEKIWQDLKGHESNRLEEMEKQIKNYNKGKCITSKDHRVVQAIGMKALQENKKAKYSSPQCVSKSWPQYWKFLDCVKTL